MNMFGKLQQMVGVRSQNEKELIAELNDMQEKYNALKVSHETTLQMLEKAKKSDNSILEAYERLKKQFADLTMLVAVKKNQDFESIKQQQEEVSKQKDMLKSKEKELESLKTELDFRSKCLGIFEAGNT
jgi:small-conductance mechanosensitive channel